MKSIYPLIFIVILSFVLYQQTFAHESFYQQHAKGWHWYEDPIENEENSEEVTALTDPSEQMNVVRSTIKRALDKAVLQPTESNVKEYISLQNQLMTQSSQFSNVWKNVLLQKPELDYSLIHPTNNLARQIESDQENIKEEAAILWLSKQYGLFFFYRSTCPYCQRFAPIVKHFADQYGVTVIPITTDGVMLPEFPNSLTDQGQAETFDVTVEPALFAVNPYTKKAHPVGYGLMSEADLKKRILEMTERLQGRTP